jgi:acetyltransferase-like isoleucine patch superfamily enzyme
MLIIEKMPEASSAPTVLPRRAFAWRLLRRVIASARLCYARIRYARARFGNRVEVRARFCLRQAPGATVIFEDRCIVDNDMTIECSGLLRVRARTIFGHHCTIAAMESIEIGEDCLIAEMVSIRDHNHRFDRLDVPVRCQGMTSAPIRIGRNVWIGGKATIIKGVTIGDNAVIGANAVVTHDVPANSIAVGVPARVIKVRA